MSQQQSNFKERVEQWALVNGFKVVSVNESTVQLERLSDGYPMDVKTHLLGSIMKDEGF